MHVESRSRDTGDRHRAAYTHRNMRSICLDLQSEAGHAVANRLAANADVCSVATLGPLLMASAVSRRPPQSCAIGCA